MCTDHRRKSDIIDVFDASYVQCGWDGEQIFVLEDFNLYTPLGLAKITRPTCSVHRQNKAKIRGFIPILRMGQQIMWVVKNPMQIYRMTDLPLEQCLKEVNLHGDYNPYIETSYYTMDNSKYYKCNVTVNSKQEHNVCWYNIFEDNKHIITSDDDPLIHPVDDGQDAVVIKGDTLIRLGDLENRVYPAWKLVDINNGRVKHIRIIADPQYSDESITEAMVKLKIGDDIYEIPIDQLSKYKLK